MKGKSHKAARQPGVPSGKKKRKVAQRKVERYQKLREDLQIAGRIQVEPVGAVRNEAVDPSTQGEQRTISLDTAAVRNGWEVPVQEKPRVIDRLLTHIDTTESAVAAAMCANAVFKADQQQWERDHPEEMAKRSARVEVNNTQQVNVINYAALYQQALIDVQHDEVEERITALEEQARQVNRIAPSNGEQS